MKVSRLSACVLALALTVSNGLINSNASIALADDQPEVNFKFYSPDQQAQPANAGAQTQSDSGSSAADGKLIAEKPVKAKKEKKEKHKKGSDQTAKANESESATTAAADAQTEGGDADKQEVGSRLLKGYVRVVPSGTKIPIIMDTAIDSDTSQEGDEFTARTGDDLMIDGASVLSAGSVIKGRIARIQPPKNLSRSGSISLKFDTVTTPDNRQIPIVANLVAKGGVVHARRGMKDVAIGGTIIALPALAGVGIGVLAGGKSSTTTNSNGTTSSSHKISKGMGAVIGAGIGVGVGVAILAIKKGNKVDVRPGDEMKIELGEDLRMPMVGQTPSEASM